MPPPSSTDVVHDAPDFAEAQATAAGIAFLVAPEGGLTHLQHLLIEALFKEITGHVVDIDHAQPITPAEFAQLLSHRSLVARERILQLALLAALVLRPIPHEIDRRLNAVADELGVGDSVLQVIDDFAHHAYALAAKDFDRNGYCSHWHPETRAELHTSMTLHAPWEEDDHDPELAALWNGLADLPQGTLGRGLWDMYLARGFVVPGLPGSAPPLLAQHDWVHVLAEYGTMVESELEVFALIARANPDMHAFSLLAMVVSLFETGSLSFDMGLFHASPGHMTAHEGVAIRLADAMRRGAMCKDPVTGEEGVDFLRVDWFDFAPLTVEEARERFGIVPRSLDAVQAGSVTLWEAGGLSPFQLKMGLAMAEEQGRTYEAFGASVIDDPNLKSTY